MRGLRPKVTIATAAIPRVPAADANYAQPWTYTKLRDVFGVARVEWDVAPNAMLYAAVGARDGRERGLYGAITVTDAASGAANGNGLYVPRTDNNEAAQAGLRVKLAAGRRHAGVQPGREPELAGQPQRLRLPLRPRVRRLRDQPLRSRST